MTDTVANAAAAPSSFRAADGEQATAHPLSSFIAADKYSRATTALAGRRCGVVFRKLAAHGAVLSADDRSVSEGHL